MDIVVQEWNSHRIRKTKNSIAPAGRLMLMFDLPELYGSQNYLVHLAAEDVEVWEAECSFIILPCDEDFFELFNLIATENNFIKSSNPFDVVLFYISLRKEVLQLLPNNEYMRD